VPPSVIVRVVRECRGRRAKGILLLALLGLAWRSLAQEPAVDGLRYEIRKSAEPLSIHVLEVRPEKIRIAAVRALGEGLGREVVSSIAQRRSAAAAVNAGFFTIGGRYDGEPDGVLKIGADWFSDGTVTRAAIGWTDDGRDVRIGKLAAAWSLRIAGKPYGIDGLNRSRGAAERILYTWAFHRSTLTDPSGVEVRIGRGRVAGVQRGGDSAIPPGGFVYSAGPDAGVSLQEFRPKQRVLLERELRSEGDDRNGTRRWEQMDYIVGGIGVLVRAGEMVRDHSDQKVRQGFITDRHPRTAVGIRPDGTWIFVVVDGRQQELSRGMTLEETAAFMHSLGCRDAVNLDGGGSSTFYVGGRVRNSPSDGHERPVSDAILFFPR
jgi:hypothetical protein